MPLTPQGVVGLKPNKDYTNASTNMTGKEFLKNFEIDGDRVPDDKKNDLIQFINKSSFTIFTEEESAYTALDWHQRVFSSIDNKQIVYIPIIVISIIFMFF